ncbi:ABC transporter permease [Streptococcus pantholopis]|uniref:Glycine/betaine ABC transporter permease n=1 Tax=Streptococcus pantholopis TaxID=1811193 RepID=A0A172Q6V7_9STRE|nr:ABC transporter permease [Streptococcus pantholopis]AND79198.1 glycine/betaine ABC transporter permease [Streptococcus pantholopis]
MIDYFQTSSEVLMLRLLEHIEITASALFFALLLAASVTVLLRFYPQLQNFSVYVLSLLYAVPSFALFALLIPWTGLGRTTAIVVLVIYAQYTLVRTFLAGLLSVDDSIIEAALGMGMTDWQVFYKIQLPLAKASVFAGIRLAATSIIAMATIAATINAGGLGTILFDGLRTRSFPKLLWGILLTVAFSLLTNLVLYLIEELLQKNTVSQPAPK